MKKLWMIGAFSLLCVVMTGCDSSDYKQAIEYQNQGEYQKAVELFDTIPDYEDSKQKSNECKGILAATDKYNTVKESAEEKNKELDKAILDAETMIKEKKTPLKKELIENLETSISDAKAAKVDIPAIAKNAKDIRASVEILNKIDYSKALQELSEHKTNLENSIKQYALVKNPKEGYIIKCLKKVPVIKDISAVTEKNDPNGNLHKPGGYTSQVYFSCKWVDQSQFTEKTIIDKGTDCGGSIEVYKTAEDAKKRNDYLAEYDGGIFASGSHKVVGTVVVRTSDKLAASKQKKLEKAIIKQLTWV